MFNSSSSQDKVLFFFIISTLPGTLTSWPNSGGSQMVWSHITWEVRIRSRGLESCSCGGPQFQNQNPTHTGQLTPAGNSSPWRIGAFFWPLQAPTYMFTYLHPDTQTHKTKNKINHIKRIEAGMESKLGCCYSIFLLI